MGSMEVPFDSMTSDEKLLFTKSAIATATISTSLETVSAQFIACQSFHSVWNG